MIIRGILDRSLSNQLCIRGFASIKQLARISKADYTYQRDLYGEQEEIVKRFLETEKYLFFPEVILSYSFKHKGDSSNSPFRKIKDFEREEQARITARSNVDKTKVILKKSQYKSLDTRGVVSLQVVELDLDDRIIDTLIASNSQPFHRIDGNHRLTVAENSSSSIVQNMTAPFCIILGEEYYDNNNNLIQTDDSKEFDKSIRVYFHNINTKSLPLTSEQNLSVIIDDADNFPDEELIDILGVAGVKTRELRNKVSVDYFTGIAHIINDESRTFYTQIFHQLLSKGISSEDLVDKVLASLKAVDHLYNDIDKLKANSSFGLLTSFLYYHVEGNKAKFKFFIDWVLNNAIFEIEEIKAESIIKIFDKIAEKNITVFVAMPYFDGNAHIMTTYNLAYERVMEKIRDTYKHVSISLYPIMQYEGKTRDIIENMINEITQCSIFIADITGGNPNVGYELGIARALKKPTVIVRQKGDEKKVPFDYEHDVRNPYDEKAIVTLEEEVYKNVVAILANDYGYVIENI